MCARKQRRTINQETSTWLDNEQDVHQKTHKREKIKKKQKLHNRSASWLKPEEGNATVKEVYKKICRVRFDETGQTLLCPYKRADVFHENFDGFKERTPVAVGDRVKVKVFGSTDGIVEGVCERKNYLVRPAPGREEGMIHVLVTNIDYLVIVCSVMDPEFSPGIIDRFLIASQMAGIEALICVNKIDLNSTDLDPLWKRYNDIGFQVFEVSAKYEKGVDDLREVINQKKVAFCGHSGVGKTSLIQRLIGQQTGKVGEVSGVTGKGKHTTTGAVLLDGPNESQWIDTPGVKSFGLHKIKASELKEYFLELNQSQCEDENCLHIDEEGCQAKEHFRYASYLRIYESLESGEY